MSKHYYKFDYLAEYYSGENDICNACLETLHGEIVMVECNNSKYCEIEDKFFDFSKDFFNHFTDRNFISPQEAVEGFYEKLQEILTDKDIIRAKKFTDNPEDDDFYMYGLLIEPESEPVIIKISRQNELSELQKAVDGLIEVINIENPYTHTPYCLIVNEENKMLDMQPNFPLRAKLYGINSEDVIDLVCGNALIFSDLGEDFDSLTPSEARFWADEIRGKKRFLGEAMLECGEPRNYDFPLEDFLETEKSHRENISKTLFDDFEI